MVTKSSIETEDQGREFGKSLKPGALVFLSGELGAGKTCFTKGIALGLGINEDIKSPSFTIINEYVSGTLPLFHIDLYRLGGGDIFELGIDEYISRGGVTV
ncbi:MAG: tRNA (adenosine(37)-N6)-threonylcarbamoyltransferase complex ATPase subunit type 1 TsaE, partial [Deltaproteobacteria bacterium]|nr:tRNA (adenosine(37)-N6)-threonylcarbamoyltransferase complex ATPase subunit type 1 TsaE [Deltaproteobacteria bacterium]